MLTLLLIAAALIGQSDSNHGQQHIQADVTLVNPAQKDFYDKGIFWANLVLASVGIAGIWVGLRTLRKIERQTQSIESQVKSQMDADRAWVMAEVTFRDNGGLSVGGSMPAIQTITEVEIRVTNAGPTPAWIFEQWVQLKVSPEVIASRTKYQSPQFPFIGEGKTAAVNYQIHPMVQGQNPVIWKAHIWDDQFPTEENGLHAYIFGVVRYRDAFSAMRETYFGYHVKGYKLLERIPNDAYNRHT